MPSNETSEPCPSLVQEGVTNIEVDNYKLSLDIRPYWGPYSDTSDLVFHLGKKHALTSTSSTGYTHVLTKDDQIFLRLFASRIELVAIDSDVNSYISSNNSFHPSNYSIFNLSSASFEELGLPVDASSTKLSYSPEQKGQIRCNGDRCGEDGRPADNGFSQPLIIAGVHSRPKGYGKLDASSPSCAWTENQVT